jgi:CheY-like chemotaxis protein
MEEKKSLASVHQLNPGAIAKRRVLVVEDNLDTVQSMATLIKMMGYDVCFAINGFAAIEIAREFRPDVLLIDIGLPDFEGDQIASQLRFEPNLQHTRIIAISGLPEDELAERSARAGCAEYHRKPIEPAVLEKLLGKPGEKTGI